MANKFYTHYRTELPRQLINSSQNKYADGLIRLCNPDTYLDVFSDGYSEQDAIIFATTAFGDFLVWEKGKYVNLVSFSKHNVTVLESGFKFFFEDIDDEKFLNEHFDYELFLNASLKLGRCKDDECFISNPIPCIGGNATIEKLKIGKLKVYNAMSIALAGGLP